MLLEEVERALDLFACTTIKIYSRQILAVTKLQKQTKQDAPTHGHWSRCVSRWSIQEHGTVEKRTIVCKCKKFAKFIGEFEVHHLILGKDVLLQGTRQRKCAHHFERRWGSKSALGLHWGPMDQTFQFANCFFFHWKIVIVIDL